MTDVIRPANGQTAAEQSARNAWQDPHSMAGYDGASGGRNLVAPESGEASAWPNRPGAASPAGWLLPADGEAAPPFRHGMEPVRSDHTSASAGADDDEANDDDQAGAWYADPQPTSLHPVGGLWPWSFQNGSRHIPVVGPTQALRGRPAAPEWPCRRARSPGCLIRSSVPAGSWPSKSGRSPGWSGSFPAPNPTAASFSAPALPRRHLRVFSPSPSTSSPSTSSPFPPSPSTPSRLPPRPPPLSPPDLVRRPRARRPKARRQANCRR